MTFITCTMHHNVWTLKIKISVQVVNIIWSAADDIHQMQNTLTFRKRLVENKL